MFTAQQVRALQQQSVQWLSASPTDINENNVEQLRDVLRFNEHRYYVLNEPLISDGEYDIIFKKLQQFEKANPICITTDSPTQRVGKGMIKNFAKVQHLVPMLSLDNSYNADDLIDFDRKVRELSGQENIEYCIEPKFDGASISLFYENDKLIRGTTRGDGEVGDDITDNVYQIKSIPLTAAFSKYGIHQIEIRGEVLINKNNFAKHNNKLMEEGLPPMANPRNAAAGALRMKDTAVVRTRNLEAFLYHVSYITQASPPPPIKDGTGSGENLDSNNIKVDLYNKANNKANKIQSNSQSTRFPPPLEGLGGGLFPPPLEGLGGGLFPPHLEELGGGLFPFHSGLVGDSHSSVLKMLWELGLKSPQKELHVTTGIQNVIAFIQNFEESRDALPYEIDGMVIKVNQLALQEKLGMTSHHPRWAIAYKFKARQATSKLLGVEYQVGRTGAVTPVAKIAAVQVGGVTVTSISIHNQDYIKEKNLKIGDVILIERSGDVIPQIVKSLAELRTGNEAEIVFPTKCPVCADALVRPEGEVVWRCVNINCAAQVVERIIHFVSKDAMDIRSLGEANVRKFIALQIITDLPSIYTLKENNFDNVEGFGNKSITNLLEAIEQSKQQPIHRLIYGLGIRYVGENTAKTLAQNITNVFELANKTADELKLMDDVGIKVAQSIVAFFKNEDNIEMLKKLQVLGLKMEGQPKQLADGELAGKTFLFTGTLNKLKRNEAEAMAEAKGAKILSGVSSKLNYLVVGDDAGSKLEKAKKLVGIHIINEDDFIALIDTPL